jgi:RimJ/RimL family protein N-acetyltransferase
MQARNQPDVYQYFYEYEPLSLETQEAWFKNFIADKSSRGSNQTVFMIRARTGKEFDPLNPKPGIFRQIGDLNERVVTIGSVSVYNIDRRSRKAEWGKLFLVGDVRGKGYGKEIEAFIYRYAFEHLNLHKLYCEVYSENESVIRLHERMGSRVDGVLREHVYNRGKYKDVTCMSITEDEYWSLKEAGKYADYFT